MRATGSNGSRVARTAGVCPGCGFRMTRDIVFRRAYLPCTVGILYCIGTYFTV